MRYANRVARPVAIIVTLLVAAVIVAAVWPRSHTPAGQCRGTTGSAARRQPYAVVLRTDTDRVVSAVDFDGRLWRAVGDRVALSGLAQRSATSLSGALTLVNTQEAAFSSAAGYATFRPVTRADGCTALPVVASGARVQTGR
ncbi:MAG TPA: hypothetical protein VFA84_13270 [Acidimicrobiales bacterium]|nr:hypothetical protein [Acidimicrobiales bacterium]